MLLALLWGSSFFFMEVALTDIGPVTLVFGRVVLAALALVLYCLLRGIRITFTRERVVAFIIMGIIANVFPFTLIALGQVEITSSLSAIIIATTPLFSVLLGHYCGRKEPATPAKLAGVLTGIIGVTFLIGFDALAEVSTSPTAQLAIVGAAFFYGLSAVYGRRFSGIPPVVTSAAMLSTASLIMAPLTFMLETPFDPLPALPAWSAVVALGLASTALAYLLYFRILADAGATNAMLVTFIQPPVSIFLGIVFLSETVAPHQFGGLAIILAGLVLVDGRLLRFMSQQEKREKA